MIVGLGAAGALIAVMPEPKSPAPVAQLPFTYAPTTEAATPTPAPSPSTSPVRTSAATRVRVVHPPASRRAPTSPATTAPTSPAPFQATFEAESQRNVMGGQARAMPRDDASDGLVVRFVGNNEDNFLRFTSLTVPDTGTYNVRIQYISGDPRDTTILVNGHSLGSMTFPASPDWYTVDTLSLRLGLNAGPNTIEMRNDTDYAPDFDRIDVTR
ncbi:hypothetical protein [Actinoplanes sp. NPDC049681]|uniref:hypothetical protein n=1 Tax=Actinoplanes sp. NPDC049681 TaxID=3363905 RepID=UPI0037AE1913